MKGAAVARGIGCIALLAASCRPALPDPATLPVLRHLTFKTSVMVRGVSESQREDSMQAIRAANPSAGGSLSSGDTITVRASAQAAGSIVADVVAATDDAGLVVDVSETADTRSRKRVRVAIYSDGRLEYPGDADLTEEEEFLLMMLARRIVPTQPTPDATWNLDQDGKSFNWHTNFRIIDASAPEDVTLEVSSSLVGHGLGIPAIESHGRISYDQTKDVPRAIRIDTKVRRQMVSTSTTTDLTITVELGEDSFAKTAQ